MNVKLLPRMTLEQQIRGTRRAIDSLRANERSRSGLFPHSRDACSSYLLRKSWRKRYGGKEMANICDNKLTVVGLIEKPKEFLDSLEKAVYGQVLPRGDQFFSVVADWQTIPTFRFETKWQPPATGSLRCPRSTKARD